ncbi:MAG: sigma-54-dependent Fis family transcriptional regulator [Deltaproteobacteria bacterium]|nr:sigma-54-dependent Fis family transcriptional regulator [Deltaproteobacteria bacterium]
MSVRPVVLVVDDKPNMVRLMSKVLRGDATVRTAESGADAIRALESGPVGVVLCDLMMGDMDGLDVLRACKRLQPRAEFILMTAFATVGTAVEALRLGAYDYLTKPFEPDEARAVVLRALGRVAARPDPVVGHEVLPGFFARSPNMERLAELVRRVANSDATALILGETGTGKERIARALHQLSPRSPARFVALNCAAIPAELLETELFGHARGAFTGAVRDRVGLFEEADGGTLFLDEIGDMRLSLQSKLTRVLEEQTIRRVGETNERKVDVRLVAATHRDLEAMVKHESFREDLWYRLNVALIRIPPLRERREDVEILAQHFLRERAEESRGPPLLGFTQAALDALTSYAWPGNVRQLRAAVERASVVATTERIDAVDLPPEVLGGGASSAPLARELAELSWADAIERGRSDVARAYFEAVLRKFDGQIALAAQHAGVERESFYRLLRKHGIDPGSFRGKSE